MDITESHRERFAADGFLLLPNAVDRSALGELRETVKLFYKAWDRMPVGTRKGIATEGKDSAGEVREINWPVPAISLLNDNAAISAIRILVNALQDRPMRIIHVNSLLKPAGGDAVSPHQDTAYNVFPLTSPVTVWIPFESCHADNGTVFYYRGSHRVGEINHRFKSGVRWISPDDLSELHADGPVAAEGDSGFVAIHDSRVVHGSFPNSSDRERLALSVRFDIAKSSDTGAIA